jgi:FtsH-binding integral membrane protein
MMAAFGLFAAWLVSIFIPAVYFWVAAIGVVVFAGLTAWDTQKIKQIYLMNGGRGNLAILGALTLYVDFVNIFVFLLHLFGGGGRD